MGQMDCKEVTQKQGDSCHCAANDEVLNWSSSRRSTGRGMSTRWFSDEAASTSVECGNGLSRIRPLASTKSRRHAHKIFSSNNWRWNQNCLLIWKKYENISSVVLRSGSVFSHFTGSLLSFSVIFRYYYCVYRILGKGILDKRISLYAYSVSKHVYDANSISLRIWWENILNM